MLVEETGFMSSIYLNGASKKRQVIGDSKQLPGLELAVLMVTRTYRRLLCHRSPCASQRFMTQFEIQTVVLFILLNCSTTWLFLQCI